MLSHLSPQTVEEMGSSALQRWHEELFEQGLTELARNHLICGVPSRRPGCDLHVVTLPMCQQPLCFCMGNMSMLACDALLNKLRASLINKMQG